MIKEKLSNIVKNDIISFIFTEYFNEILDNEIKESIVQDVLIILKEHFPIGKYQGQVYFTENSILNIEIQKLSICSQIHKMILDITRSEIRKIENKTEEDCYFAF